jgi:hypothetical protein
MFFSKYGSLCKSDSVYCTSFCSFGIRLVIRRIRGPRLISGMLIFLVLLNLPEYGQPQKSVSVRG